MATVAAPPIARTPAAGHEAPAVERQQHFVIDHLGWDQYEAIARALDETHVRINYDRGRLELITISSVHERLKRLLARFIDTLTLELLIPIHSVGSWTLRRADANRGAESDDCYYIQNEPVVRGRDHIDLESDPPPDLGVERNELDETSLVSAFRDWIREQSVGWAQ
ncbi:MAG TPA: hypothetical protein VML55_05535 [Planctomycetaceae bacterium]|nr:hypothetical protein [Planctomycetaceae bacterium]